MPPALPSIDRLFADRYQVEAVLGAGGMGAVYRVRDLALGEDVALKLLGFGGDPSPAALLRFRQEVRLARRVTHRNVARVYDVGEDNGAIFLTMELIVGATLKEALKERGTFPVAAAARIGVELCAGLTAAHEAGIVHRDLKPANVMIENTGRVVMMDFGVARSLLDDSNLTNGMIGTPRYMAPEQAANGSIDARTDLFALGLVLAELVSGTVPSDRDAARAALIRAPAELVSTIEQCMSPSADNRPRSAEDVAKILRLLASDVLPPELTVTAVPAVKARESVQEVGLGAARTPPSKASSGARERSLAVLPFRYRGPKEDEDIGESLAEALVDVLASTRGLRVIGRPSGSRPGTDRGARSIGGELGVDAVIEGNVQVSGTKRRVTIRLIDVALDMQSWSGHFDAEGGDVFEFTEKIAGRIAERLRSEITVLVHRGNAPDEAVQMFLEAQRKLSEFELPLREGAIDRLEQCIALAPDFAPAFAAHAMACVRAWVMPGDPTPAHWEVVCQSSVARALGRSSDLAESHLAAGLFHIHAGDAGVGARAVSRAVHLAPTSAEGQETLGMLECEGGRPELGVPRLRRALDFNPNLANALSIIARSHALAGRRDEYDRVLREIIAGGFGGRIPIVQVRARSAAWFEDKAALRALIAELEDSASSGHHVLAELARALLGEISDTDLDKMFQMNSGPGKSPRVRAAVRQGFAEVMAARGNVDKALEHITAAADGALIDITWLDKCPLLEPLKTMPDFVAARKKVLARVHAMWVA